MTPAASDLEALAKAHDALMAEMSRRDFRHFRFDPLAWVMWAYPWGTPALPSTGPDEWQTQFLADLGQLARQQAEEYQQRGVARPIRMAVSSGHGTGKSTLAAWLVGWIMDCRPGAKGKVTANTYTQLETTTWASILYWAGKSLSCRDRFVIGQGGYYRIGQPERWKCTPQSCREENSEAFAGQHAADSTSFYLFDGASAIPSRIWEVAEGGLTDGMPMIFAFGNPTRNTGAFYEACFGDDRGRWNARAIDSRVSRLTNKETLAEWAEKWGEDSDYFRVRVRGLPPRASELQFIDRERVDEAMSRNASSMPDEPLVAGMDVSGGGSALTVIRFRRGLDARSIPPIEIPGDRDRQVIVAKVAEILADTRPDRRVSMMFIDSAFGSPIVERLHSLGFRNVAEVNFGGGSPDEHLENFRAYMWNQMKDWLLRGAVDRHKLLEVGLVSPGFHLNKSNRIVLESKQDMQRRGVSSPDHADALALTFARAVAIAKPAKPPNRVYQQIEGSPHAWMG